MQDLQGREDAGKKKGGDAESRQPDREETA